MEFPLSSHFSYFNWFLKVSFLHWFQNCIYNYFGYKRVLGSPNRIKCFHLKYTHFTLCYKIVFMLFLCGKSAEWMFLEVSLNGLAHSCWWRKHWMIHAPFPLLSSPWKNNDSGNITRHDVSSILQSIYDSHFYNYGNCCFMIVVYTVQILYHRENNYLKQYN